MEKPRSQMADNEQTREVESGWRWGVNKRKVCTTSSQLLSVRMDQETSGLQN